MEPHSTSKAGVCHCGRGQLCRRCLGPIYAGLLQAAVGGDQDVDCSSQREPGACGCQERELCRTCAPGGFQELVFRQLGDKWRRSNACERLTPLEWLALTGMCN